MKSPHRTTPPPEPTSVVLGSTFYQPTSRFKFCKTKGHENYAASATNADGVDRCFTCSFEFELRRVVQA